MKMSFCFQCTLNMKYLICTLQERIVQKDYARVCVSVHACACVRACARMNKICAIRLCLCQDMKLSRYGSWENALPWLRSAIWFFVAERTCHVRSNNVIPEETQFQILLEMHILLTRFLGNSGRQMEINKYAIMKTQHSNMRIH